MIAKWSPWTKNKNEAEADGEGMCYQWIPNLTFSSYYLLKIEHFHVCRTRNVHSLTYILGPRKFTFPSHQSHMLTLAKMCQDNSDYTDCVIQCGDFSSDDTEEEHERNR